MVRRTLWVSAVALGLAAFPVGSAHAEPNDDAATALVTGAMKDDPSVAGNAVKAQAKLSLARKLCERGCSPKVRAQVLVALGTVQAVQKKDKDAKESFAAALKDDPAVTLFPDRSPPEAKKLFEEAKAEASGAKPAPPPPAPAAPAPADPKKKGPPKGLKKECSDEGAPPKDWQSHAAFCYFVEAVASEAAQEWADCIAFADASLFYEDRPTTRYLGAQCRERGGKWVDALREYQLVADSARRAGMQATAQEATTRGRLLKERIGKIVIRPPAGATDLVVMLDGEPVPQDKLGGEIWVTPGPHIVTATGKIGGGPLKFNTNVTVGEAQTKAVDLAPGTGAASQDPRVLKCLLEAKSDAEIEACVNKPTSTGLNLKVTTEVSGYTDSDNVNVITPGVAIGVESPTDGWGARASFLVDVVTAASVDVISNGSPRWTEIRYVPAISGHKKIGDADVSLRGNLSVEPDYLAIGTGAGLSLDLREKTVTPNIGYDFGYELSGRAGTPFEVFSLPITTHAIVLGTTFVLDKQTIFVPTLTGAMLFGDTSKPYRYLPIFAEGTTVLPGETVESVNQLRLPVRVAEAVPEDRKRLALSLLFARRFSSVTLRLDERVYIDSWGLKASTTDFLLPVDFTDWLRVWPHLRAHVQTGVDFWQLAYTATPQAGGLALPLLRTGDREAGPLLTGTGGLGFRFGFGHEQAYGLVLSGDAMYTRFLDHLYIQGRFAVFAATALEMEFE